MGSVQMHNREVDGKTYDLTIPEERTAYITASTQAEVGRDPTADEMEQATNDWDYVSGYRDKLYDTDEGRDYRNVVKTENGIARADDWVAQDHDEGETFHAGGRGERTLFKPQDAQLFVDGYYEIGDEFDVGWYVPDGFKDDGTQKTKYVSGPLEDYDGRSYLYLSDKGTAKDSWMQAAINTVGIDELKYLDPDLTVIKTLDNLGLHDAGDLAAAISEISRGNMSSIVSADPERMVEGTDNTWERAGVNDYYTYSDAAQETIAAAAGTIFSAGNAYVGAAAYTATKLGHATRDQYQYGNVDMQKLAVSIGVAWAGAAVSSYFQGAEGASAASDAGTITGDNAVNALQTTGRYAGEGASNGWLGTAADATVKAGANSGLSGWQATAAEIGVRGAIGTGSSLAQGNDFDDALITGLATAAAGQATDWLGDKFVETKFATTSGAPELLDTVFRTNTAGVTAYSIARWAGRDHEQAKKIAISTIGRTAFNTFIRNAADKNTNIFGTSKKPSTTGTTGINRVQPQRTFTPRPVPGMPTGDRK